MRKGPTRRKVLASVAGIGSFAIIGRTRAGRAARWADPAARPGWRPSEQCHTGPTVLTHLLTTTLDYPGHVRSEKPREQGRCDRLAVILLIMRRSSVRFR